MKTDSIPFKSKETDILERFRRGNESALGQVMNMFSNNLIYTCVGITKDQLASEDIVVDAFHKAWGKRECFDSLQKVKSYLYVVCKHACFHFLDKIKATKVAVEESSYLRGEFEDDVLEGKIRTEMLSEIKGRIDMLPEKPQRLLRMIFDEGLSTNEVAEIYKIPAQHVRVNKSRALFELKSLCRHIVY